ncbi:ESX secretion-associated protein EspG [Nocardia paucivorans]|uniref:ESX secretion-associated protein EspG n=1 Tax=Nocardia paucivorans TaxID=114259 RepID=UPI0002DEBE02|nr:ESX secretion-associated protein EspG [Nocardia paucivorans]
MTRTWKFTDFEFVVAWETAQADILPAPFVFTSRTELYDDYQREKREMREQLRHRLDGEFENVLDIVARPDIRIVVHGWGSDFEDAESQIRLLAVRREGYGYVLKQLPGETAWHSGGYTVTECGPLALADALIAELPEADPGKLKSVALVERAESDDMDFAYGRSLVEDSFDDTVEEQAGKFLAAPITGEGIVEIAQGISRFGPRGIARKQLAWRDIDGDGRYAITGSIPPIARGVDAKQFVTLVNSGVAEVVKAIRDERL